MVKHIRLSHGTAVAIVDDDDYEWLKQWNWAYHNGYAIRGECVNGRYRTVPMHRVINQTPEGYFTDHRDGNKLNNCKSNLRSCTKSQNEANKTIQKRTLLKRKYKGTGNYTAQTGEVRVKPWYARIVVDRRAIHLGYYHTEEEAAVAYNKAALKYFGEFAKLNEVANVT